jgi:hypothetical protein
LQQGVFPDDPFGDTATPGVRGFAFLLLWNGAALLLWFIRIEAERGSVRDEMLGAR